MGELWQSIIHTMASWYKAKLFIEHLSAASNDALHVIVGVLIQLVACLLLRRPISALRPWLAVFVLIVWNEASDLWIERWPDPAIQYGEGARDLLLTLLLPTILLFAARLRPDLFGAQGRKRR